MTHKSCNIFIHVDMLNFLYILAFNAWSDPTFILPDLLVLFILRHFSSSQVFVEAVSPENVKERLRPQRSSQILNYVITFGQSVLLCNK